MVLCFRNLFALDYKERKRAYPTEAMWQNLGKDELEVRDELLVRSLILTREPYAEIRGAEQGEEEGKSRVEGRSQAMIERSKFQIPIIPSVAHSRLTPVAKPAFASRVYS